MNEVFILSAKRTPIGSLMGSLSTKTAPELGSLAIKAAIEASALSPSDIEECVMGNVLTAGVGQAPARQAMKFAGVPDSSVATTVNKVCGSGLKATMLLAQNIQLGEVAIGVSGGMESMSNAPYLLPKARNGYRYGNAEVLDSIQYDGLTDVYNKVLMGNAADLCAKECQISREAQDEFTVMSYERARKAQSEGKFASQLTAVSWEEKGKTVTIIEDDEPKNFKPDKIPQLKPAFSKDGTVTPANSSKINDGASATVLASGEAVRTRGLKPLAKIIAFTAAAKDPIRFTTAPIDAMEKLFKKTGLTPKEIDLFEINEAFAVVTMAAQKSFGIDHTKVNINGGAVALGHPIGASGNRILVTLVHALHERGLKRGIAAICIGGGEACAMLIETV
ncbi:MAG: thiolase family protein [Chloroherpetonaceae bacterium]|nr:thiolase family protein [Chloroherpetonaceae bacterium]